MQKFIRCIIWCCALALNAAAQPANISRVEYYIDTDPGFGKATAVTITAATSLTNLTININPANVGYGVHVLGIRAQNANGKWGIDNKWLFARPYAADTGAQTPAANISRVEYYLDNDPGFGKATAVTTTPGTSLANITLSINPANVGYGVHVLGIRAQNALGKWGIDNKWLFARPYPSDTATTAISNITRVEYYIDKDPGFGKAKSITFTPGTSLANAAISVPVDSSLTNGVHVLGIRAQNALGKWGFDNKWLFARPYATDTVAYKATAIKQIEYYFDNDPGYGKGIPVVVDTGTFNLAGLNLAINISGLTAAGHNLFVRARNANGNWGFVYKYSFKVSTAVTAPAIAINRLLRKAAYCAKDTLAFSYDATGTYAAGNQFTLQLSDTTGAFTTPTTVGTFTATGDSIVKLALPAHLAEGNKYRIRLVSSSPAVTGITGSDTLVIHDAPRTVTITGDSAVNIKVANPYSVATLTGYTWKWLATNTTPVASTNTASITWPAAGTQTIKVIAANVYGCSGDTTVKVINAYPLRIDSVNLPTLKPCPGDSIAVTAKVSGAYKTGNVFTVQLSDTAGNFTSPVKIGSLPLVAAGNLVPVTIKVGLPNTLINGIHYRMRVIGSTPADTSAVTSSYVVIQKPNLGKDTVVSVCAGSSFSLLNFYNTTELTTIWSTPRPDSATVAGAYTLIVTNTNGCKDTAVITLNNFPKPNLGKDTVISIPSGSLANITTLYNTTGLTPVYSTATPAAVGAGVYTLIVTSSYGCKDTAVITVKTFAAAPVIYSFGPATGGAGVPVTIKGRYFTGATVVSFGGTAAASFTVLSDTVISAVTGNGASGNVLVTTPSGTATLAGFVFCTPVSPSVTIAANAASPICTGTKVTFTATAVNGGTAPVYQWYKNNTVVGSASTYTDSLLKNSDSVWVVVTSNAACLVANTAKSNVLKYVVNAAASPSVTITANVASPICTGTKVTFTATAVNGGTTPVYQWYKNNVVVGSASTYTDSLLKNSDSVWVVVTSNAACLVANTAKSNVLKYVVNTAATPSVTITANVASPICAGTKVTFTAAVVNGGTTPVYQWYKNNVVVGSASTYTDSLLKNSDSVWVVVTSNAACLVANTAKSNVLKYVVNAAASPSVTITANAASPICAGTKVTFTATAVNGGTAPVYQWYKNNIVVGSASTYTDSLLKNSDSVWVVVTSNAACLVANTAKSNVLKYVVNAAASPSVTITANAASPICAGTKVTFTASVVNGGTAPVYQWYKNNIVVGSASTYTDSLLKNSDSVWVVVTSNAACLVANTAKSSVLKYVVNTAATPSVTITANVASPICAGTKVTFTAAVVNGGTTPVYQWKKNGLNVGTNSAVYTDSLLKTGDTIKVVLTASGACIVSSQVSSNSIAFIVNPVPVVTITGTGCGIAYISSNLNFEQAVWSLNGSAAQTTVNVWSSTPVTVAGTGVAGSGLTQLNSPGESLLDIYGNLYISDRGNSRVVKWAPGATTGVVVAGGNGAGTALNQLSTPVGLWLDAKSNLYVVEYANNRVTKWAPGAGAGVVVAGGNGAGAGLNQLNGPHSVTGDTAGNIYITDQGNNRVTKWAPGATSGIAVIASGQVSLPQGIAIDGASNLYVAEFSGNRVSKWAPGATIGVTVAGTGTAGTAFNQLNGPIGINVDKTGALFVTDFLNNRVQRWLPATGGTGGVATTTFSRPLSSAIDASGNLYVLEEGNNRVIKFAPGKTDTVLHTGAAGVYTATVSTYAGCTVTTAPYTQSAASMPSVSITSNTGTAICGSIPVTFTATPANGGSAPSYQWKRNGVNVGTNLPTYIDSVPVNGDSIYVVLTSNATCLAANSVNSNGIKLTVNAKPNLGKDTGLAVCTGSFINIKNLYSITGYAAAIWNLPRPDSVVAAGRDTLIVTTTAGCRDTAVVVVTVVAPPVKPVLTKTGNTTFCLGDSLVLTANAVTGLQWYRNNQAIKAATLSRYVVRAAGSYKLKVTGTGGCSVWSDSVIATVNQVPIPTITLVNDTLVSSSPTGNQWFENGVKIPGATTPKYSPDNIDVYTVQVTSGSCVSAMSYPYLYTAGTMGFKGKNKGTASVLLYPNPATDAAKLQLTGFSTGVIVTITDMTGRVVWQQDKLTNSTYTLPLSKLAQGMYLVTIKDKTTIRTIRLIKAK